jgi:succinoglycan biosynthesis protein ExoV
MRLAYWNSNRPNFGDDMNLWFWNRFLPGWQDWQSEETSLFGIGTILNDRALSRSGQIAVVGSGTGYGVAKQAAAYPRADFRFVRGPLSAQRLGLPADRAISDPAILTPEALDHGYLLDHGNTLFVPHHGTASIDLPWGRWCEAMDVEFVSPSNDSEAIIRHIAGARLVIAESMHAAIVADAFRVPWVAVQLSDGFNEFKWRDWAGSLEVPFTSVHQAASLARFMKGLTPRRRSKPGGASSPSAPADGKAETPEEGRALMRSTLQRLSGPLGLVVKAILWQALRQRPSLSDDAVLHRTRHRMRDALDRTAEKYSA